MTRLLAIAIGAAFPCALAHAGEAGGVLPAGTAEGVSGITWPGSLVACAYLLKGWRPPALVVRVTVRDGDTDEAPKA